MRILYSCPQMQRWGLYRLLPAVWHQVWLPGPHWRAGLPSTLQVNSHGGTNLMLVTMLCWEKEKVNCFAVGWYLLLLSKEEFTCNDGSCCNASFRCDGKPDCEVEQESEFKHFSHIHLDSYVMCTCVLAFNHRTWQMRLDAFLLMWLIFQNLASQLQEQPLSQQLRWLTSRVQAFNSPFLISPDCFHPWSWRWPTDV